MAESPAPFPEDVLAKLDPLVDRALDAFKADVSYGVAIISAGRKVACRKTPQARLASAAA